MRCMTIRSAFWSSVMVVAALSGCGAKAAGEAKAANAAAQRSGSDGERHDGAQCEFKGRVDREVQESVGAGALQPTIRRVYRIVGEGDLRRRILACREVDTNLDGTKDLVRFYSDQGEAVEERADVDYDGALDTWIRFAKGRISQVAVDVNRDGTPDETRYYLRGKLSRVQRDENADGKPDIWEIYAGGRLERMGIDVDHDGRVDRWNRDEVAARTSEREGSAEESESGAASSESSTESSDAAETGAP